MLVIRLHRINLVLKFGFDFLQLFLQVVDLDTVLRYFLKPNFEFIPGKVLHVGFLPAVVAIVYKSL